MCFSDMPEQQGKVDEEERLTVHLEQRWFAIAKLSNGNGNDGGEVT